MITGTEEIDAEVALTEARTNYIQALYNYAIAKAALNKALGNISN